MARQDIIGADATRHALLELYCGNGNHTCGLAPLFGSVVCVEIDKRLCLACCENLDLNGITNVHVEQVF